MRRQTHSSDENTQFIDRIILCAPRSARADQGNNVESVPGGQLKAAVRFLLASARGGRGE